MAYSSSIAFAGILPLLFLLFNREKEEEGVNKLFDVLLNYVLSPALLIYAVICISILSKWPFCGPCPKVRLLILSLVLFRLHSF